MKTITFTVPIVRFKGFTESWEKRKVGDFLTTSKIPGHTGLAAKKLTVKLWGKGIVEKSDAYQGSENTQYYIRHTGQFMYGKLDFLHAAFGIVPEKYDGYESTIDSPAFDMHGINGTFLLNRIGQTDFYLRYGNMANGSRKAMRIHEETFLDMPIVLPSLKEQSLIGHYIECVDNLITLHQRKLDQLKKLKKYFLQNMFPAKGEKVPRIRFKGFTGDWEQRKLGEMAESFQYGLNAAAKKYDGKNKYIRITDIDDLSHEFLQSNLTSPDTDISQADNYRLNEGNILFARTGASVGKTYIYKHSDGRVYYAGFLIRAKLFKEYAPEFIFQNTLTSKYKRFIQITSQRSGQPGVNAQEYADYGLMVPSLKEQKGIGKLLANLDHLITLHQRKLNQLLTMKKFMLQNLFI